MKIVDLIGPWILAAVLLALCCIAAELTNGFSSTIFP